MIGIIQSRINDVKDIDLIQYVLDKYPSKFNIRKNGEQLSYKENKALVIYKDHAYDFGEVKHPYKDSIYIEQLLSDCTFTEAVERLEVWKKGKEAETNGEVRLDMFDNLNTDNDEIAPNDELITIPDGISFVEKTNDFDGD